MPPKKKTKLAVSSAETAAGDVDISEIGHLSDDTVATIFSHFGPLELMRMRCVCKKWRDAAKKTIPAPVEFCVDRRDKYRGMAVMTTALPNIQHLKLDTFLPPRGRLLQRSSTDIYEHGEDPDENYGLYQETMFMATHDINIISRYSKLRRLIISVDYLNGRYPALFNFPLLQHLRIDSFYSNLKCDLSMLAGLPSLKELRCIGMYKMTGDLESLKVLKGNVEEVTLNDCPEVTGNFIILADFPRLKRLDLNGTAVTGDIRDIGDNDFLHLNHLLLPDTVFGGRYHEFQRVSEVPSFMNAVAPILRRFSNKHWCWKLSEESPDWYESDDSDLPEPPFKITFVRAGPRLGWRWSDGDDEVEGDELIEVSESCEINWLDSKPQRDSFGSMKKYKRYKKVLESLQKTIRFFKGYHRPPTREEYRSLCEALDNKRTRFLVDYYE